MNDFTKTIRVHKNFTAEFVFQILHTTSADQYYVSVQDEGRQRCVFTMEQRPDLSWKIIDAPKVPQWLMEIETRLEEAILKNTNP